MRRGDSEVEGGWPTWNEHVGWAPEGGARLSKAWLKQSSFFQLGVQTCGGGEVTYSVASSVVASGAVTTAGTDSGVSALRVQNRVERRTPVVVGEEVVQQAGGLVREFPRVGCR